MYYGTKGWYVAELKKLGVRYHEGRKLESYRGHVLRNLLTAEQEKTKKSNLLSIASRHLSVIQQFPPNHSSIPPTNHTPIQSKKGHPNG